MDADAGAGGLGGGQYSEAHTFVGGEIVLMLVTS